MEIALFSDLYMQLSGLSTHVRNLASILSEKGYDVTLYTGSGKSEDFKIVNLPRLPFPLAKGYEMILPRRLRLKADVVHVHTPYMLGWMALKQECPVVSTTHTTPKNLFSEFNLNFLDPLGWRFLRVFYNSSDHVICQTKSTKELFEKHGLKKPVSVISSGIDFDFFNGGDSDRFRRKYKLPKKFVLSASRLSKEKRPEWILRACRELKIPCVVSSSGPLKSYLEKKYPETKFIGYIPEKEMPDLYASATVFALTSESDVEGEGLVVFEAMAAGVPTICLNIFSLKSDIIDGENGFYCRSYEEFKKMLGHLWENESMQQKFSKEGLKKAREKDVYKSVDKIIKVYRSLAR